MTRRTFLAAPLATPLISRADTHYRDYARCLPDYLTALAQSAYQQRKDAIAKLTTAEAITARQNWVRETFWQLTGGKPERTSLNLRKTGEFTRANYRVERIVYESQPELMISANLYLPSTKGPHPGVLFQMGHSRNGKANDTYQKCCQGLVQLGYVVLAFDPMGQGERMNYPKARSADDEHSIPGRQMLLVGDTATRQQVWDAIRSLDVLAAHPMVDPKRLASTGQSGGATVTMLLAAVDDRLACAAVSSGNTENFACADFLAPGSTDDAEQNLLYSGPLGFDRWDLLYPIAPKPLLITVSARDFFGTYSPRYLTNGREEFDRLHAVYETLGHGSHIAWADTPLPHGLSYELRLDIYNWFQKWLQPGSRVVTQEPPVSVEKDEALWVTRTGSVSADLASQTPHNLLKQQAAHLPKPTTIPDLARLLSIDQPNRTATITVVGKTHQGAITVEGIEVQSAPQVWVPAWLLTPPAKPRSVLLIADAHSRSRYWQESSLGMALAQDGIIVCAADLRGIGELTPELPRGAAGYASGHSHEESFAWASLILGKPLLGQRVADLLALIAALRRHAPGQPLVLAASGKLTVPALFAAAIARQVTRLYLSGGIASFRGLTDNPEYSESFSNFIPGILKHTDLPEIAKTLSVKEGSAWDFETLRHA